MTVIEYCTEEVERQGHNVRLLDGIERVRWMLQAWAYALAFAHSNPGCAPTKESAIRIGQFIEPHANEKGIRTCHVIVGAHSPPRYEHIESMLDALFQRVEELAPMDFYKEFEHIHPFTDGNGRTGKVLLNWLNGSLLNPIFPPADLFGRPIRNP